ncbi:uncharacterized protein EAF01_002449 [Botrytis porri]|uniref:uncharacterized protein n=1 Tax=Botrytis porri TaxID=87229 RepID=UPI0019003C0B|nr:uncharacterized protein EAF01_002449 [Botrytis porri]KAF7910940.1 hypothetical protein EAF01_002449 [Botrytis porri]
MSSTSTGAAISALGYYTSVMLICMVLFAIGSGLLITLLNAGFQVLTGLGVGVGFESGIIVAQIMISNKRISMAISYVLLFIMLDGVVFVPVSQTLFQNRLVKGIEKRVLGLDARAFLDSKKGQLEKVLKVYIEGLRAIFWVSMVYDIGELLAVYGLKWKNIRKEKKEERN